MKKNGFAGKKKDALYFRKERGRGGKYTEKKGCKLE